MVQQLSALRIRPIARTLTSFSSWPCTSFTAGAAPHKSTATTTSSTPTVPMSPFAMTSRHNSRALAGAGIVALGAGAYLCARAFNNRSRVAAVSTAQAIAVEGTSQARANGVAEKETAAKSPCEGCDCGMMEPGPLEGTMHAYERHVLICSGQEDWPKVIEAEESSLAESLFNMSLGAGLIWTKKAAKEAELNKQGVAKNRVKISACAEPSRGRPGTTDVIVYPEGLIYSLCQDDTSSLEKFVKLQLVEGQVASELNPTPVSYEKMVLVCTHMTRDKRCGRAGPQVIEEMSKELKNRGVGEDRVALRGSSHFGGHRFAGVLIIYPQGDWYGMVNKKNAAAILDKCVLGTEGMKSNWRGNMANPGTKAEPAAKPAAAAAAAGTTPDAKEDQTESSTMGSVVEEVPRSGDCGVGA